MLAYGNTSGCADGPSENAKFSLKQAWLRVRAGWAKVARGCVERRRRHAQARGRQARARSLRILRELDPHILRDIGLTAADLAYWERMDTSRPAEQADAWPSRPRLDRIA